MKTFCNQITHEAMCLLCKYEDLISNLQQPCKADVVADMCDPCDTAGSWETRDERIPRIL